MRHTAHAWTPPERTQVDLVPGTKTWPCENRIVDAPPGGSARTYIINTKTKRLSKDIIEQQMIYQIKGGFYEEIQKSSLF